MMPIDTLTDLQLEELITELELCGIYGRQVRALSELQERRKNGAPEGWKLVPIEPTENMIIEGFESEPDEFFSKSEVWEEYAEMSGCEQAAHKAKLCWAAMLAVAPTPQENKS